MLQITATDFFTFNRKSQNQLIKEFGIILKNVMINGCKVILALFEKNYVIGIDSNEGKNDFYFMPIKNLIHWQLFIDRFNKNLLN